MESARVDAADRRALRRSRHVEQGVARRNRAHEAIDFEKLCPIDEASVRELREALAGDASARRAAFRSLPRDQRIRVLGDGERGSTASVSKACFRSTSRLLKDSQNW
jgi:hypothetical protein